MRRQQAPYRRYISRLLNRLVFLLTPIISTSPAVAGTILVPVDQPTIQAGIDGARQGDLILVSPGTYFESIDFHGKALSIQSERGVFVTAIDGGQAGSVVTFSGGETEDSTLVGFTIRNGLAVSGGAIYCEDASPTIIHCTIRENSARQQGGPSGGGGIYCTNSSPTIMNSTITGNQSESGGGGICCRDFSSPMIEGCIISNNRSDYRGGGVYCIYESAPILSKCIIVDNFAPSGGGVLCGIASHPLVRDSLIRGNSAFSGGGIIAEQASLTITNSAIIKNTAGDSGGGVNSNDSTLSLTNCLIAMNEAMKFGGGVMSGFFSTVTITNCTISENLASSGGGVCCWDSSSSQISSTVLYGDSASRGPEIFLGHYSDLTVRYSDLQGGRESIYIEAIVTLYWLEGNISEDPLFSRTGSYHPSEGSPCIDAGNPELYYSDQCFPPSSGTSKNDIGAFGGPGAYGWVSDLDGDGKVFL